jgi:hypothetical protein
VLKITFIHCGPLIAEAFNPILQGLYSPLYQYVKPLYL